ncbi:universal stress protein [Pseudonocardia eucalypti]|uniref:Universal stress protein n=1 Tax=Pseudonocardia eucalypti TaxID=648755 RepID=A0ABP9QI89_9PSEU
MVCLDSSRSGHAALRWAAEYARLHRSPITLALRTAEAPGAEGLADALATVREIAPGPTVDVRRRRCLRGPAELAEAGDGLLVLPADAPNAVSHALDAGCRVAFVPDRPASEGPVLLGVTTSTADEAIGSAFQEATTRKAVLRAVRVWFDPAVPIGLPTPEAFAAFDEAARRAQRELDAKVDGWAAEYPAVQVRKLVIADDPASALAALTHRARLLVVGQSARDNKTAVRLRSPLARVLRATRCPVLVVPDHVPHRR